MSKTTDVAKRRSRLSPVKRALLEKRLKGNLKAPSRSFVISRRPDQHTYPLSYAQERFWFLDQLEPGTPVYNRPMGLRLKGALDVSALEQAMNAILGRHDVLRTNFSAIKGQPIQSIAPTMSLSLDVVDLSALDAADRENESLRLSVEEALRPFELAKDPLLRAMLIRLAMEDYILLVVMHHIVCDGWSAKVFTKELAVLYEAFCTGTTSPLPELPIQYADHAYWQRQRLQGEVFDQQVSYWRDILADSPPLLDLPTDRPWQSYQTFCGANQTIMISSSLLKLLKALSRKENVTLFMTLLAAFKVLLYRHTGQMDIVVGSPIAGRSHIETEDLIGFFVNTLVLRTDLAGDPSFRLLLQRIREATFGAYENSDLPFEKLVEAVKPERQLSRYPFFQVLFNFENVPEDNISLPELSLSEFEVDSGMAAFDLSVEIREKNEELYCLVNYNTDLFENDTIRRMIKHYQILLEGVVANPDQSISLLAFLAPAERHQLLVGWNSTQTDYPQDKCIHQLFEERVKKTPDAMALVYEDQQLSYRELNRCANQLANYLQSLGVGPEVRVGLFTERSIATVIGIWAILKAGGAYVPLDPSYPKERLSLMLADINAPVLLSQQHLLDKLPGSEAHVVILDTTRDPIARQSDKNPASDVTCKNAAYVLYTSGSTGMPKGVVAEHIQLLNYCVHIIKRLKLADAQTFAMVQPVTFDSCITVLFPSLITGGTLHIVSTEKALSPEGLSNYFQKFPIDCLKITPSHLSAIQALVKPDLTMPRHCLVIGGEESKWQWVRFLSSLSAECSIFNHYGPAETTCGVLTYQIEKGGDDTNYLTAPLGRPIANIQIYILDERLNPVPVGVEGELYIGGDGVTRGYLNRPDRTAAQYIPNPFSEEPGKRMYKSGDRARYLPDGNIEFLGRRDHQVKIRGFRIELREIETTLEQHQAVQQAVVIARQDAAVDKRLVAYVVLKLKKGLAIKEVRSYLKQKLPDYMVPATYVFMDALPLTSTNKVDRHSLPEPKQVRPEVGDDFAMPRSSIEEVLADIWENLLALERIGIHENFFELGGHSLLATRLLSQIRKIFQVELALRSIFESPTVAELAQLIEASRQTVAKQPAPALQAVERDKGLPLSFAQQRLWFLDQLEPESPLYNSYRAVRLTGPLDVEALQSSFDSLVARHEALRTVFASVDGSPVQVITETRSVDLPVIDLSKLQPAERETELRRLCTREAKGAFDLSSDLMLRARLFHFEKQKHVLIIVMHHISTDHWSWGILLRELSEFYNAFKNGRSPKLPFLSVQYADFAVWQRQHLQGEVLENQLAYWKKQLSNVPSVLELSTEKHRLVKPSFRGARQAVVLSKKLSEALKNLSRQEGVTPFMILLTAFITLLHRYTGQVDIVVGSPIAGRNREEIEGLIGFFLNNLVLRTDLSGDPNFRELLSRVQKIAIEAYAHQDIPFEKLVEELQPERNFSHSPFFQIMFVLQNVPEYAMQFSGLALGPMAVEIGSSRFDLTLFLEETRQGINGAIEYNSDLFDSPTITRMAGHYQTLLGCIVANPEQHISDVQILTDIERKHLLVDWNNTSSGYPRDRCVHQLFEQQVKQTPGVVAVVYRGEQLTYRELNSRANQLSRYLSKLGVGPEVLVGLCLERSIEMVVGVLGILKTGGAYVPLDPEYPQERLGFMLADTQTPVLLTQQKLLSGLPETAARLVCLDSHWEAIGKESHENPISDAVAENLAYVMYTSGSTGRPKGVCVTHRNVVRLVKATNYASLGAEEVFLQFAPISFDASTLELWGPLLNGGRLVVFPAALPSLAQLSEVIEQHQVTILWLTAGLFHQMVEDHLGRLGSVRQLLAGGDVLSVPHVKRVLEQLDGCCLINGYGPTENTTFTTCYPMTDVSALGSSVPIGRPIANTRVYILDVQSQPVPIGVAGELYTGGDGLGRGYLNRPELTAEKFIPDPFSKDPAARLYKTGDLARYLPDGSIEFLGRIDHQVKIRGFRIELGEVESVLGRHPAVEEAVVIAREDVPGDKRLVAYAVASHEPTPTFSELRSFLKEKLPDYMIPSAFVFLDLFPLTPNGKVDRRALPTPEHSRPELESKFVAPRTPVEDAVAEFWRDSLGLEQVGIYDNFFDLGGHSLLAAKIVSRLKTTFTVDIPLRAFFDSPTIAGLSATLAMARRGKKPTEKVGILPVARNCTLPLSFAQERFWLLDQFHTNSAVFNVARGFRLRGPFQLEVFRESVQALVDSHEILRTTFANVDGEPHQVIAPTLSVEVPLQNCSCLSKEEQAGMIQQAFLEERRFQFDLAHGPLFRARLLRLAEDDHFLVLNFHHIILDAWSLEIIIKDLVTAYSAGFAGHAVTLPALSIQYVDYAHWQRDLLGGPIGREQLAFWKTQLAQLPPAIPLPTDYARPAVQTFRGARESLQLAAELLAPLRALNRQEGTTLFMVLLAALQFLLHRLTGTHDILVGSPIAGRDQQELHDLIGCFLNTLVLRTDLSGDLTGRDLLQRVREVVLNAYENQDVPFEKVLAEIDPVRDPSRTPIFQVLLNMHSFDDQNLLLPELSVTRVHSTEINSLFDMTLYFIESADEIHLNLVYNADLYTAERMTEFMRQFQSILEQMINDPDRPLEAFTLVTPSNRLYLPDPSALLTEPLQTSIIEMFDNWVKRTPEQPALSKGDQTLTYEKLFQRIQTLARILRLNGLDRRDVVAVYGPRSFGLIVNMMAVFLSGGVLLPIDSSLPRQRQQLIFQEAGAKFLLYIRGRGFEDAWWEQGSALGVQSLEVDTKGLVRADTDFDLDAVSLPEIGIDDAAYIFFTSGTTGVPKGVLGSHKGLNHFLNWQRETFGITPEDRVAHLTSLSFDPVLREIFLPLTSGATLCLPEDIDILAANDVLSWLDRERISILHTVPSLAQSWLTNSTVEVSLNAMRWVFFAGESLTESLVNRWQSSFPSAEIVNLYGPAETTLAKCFYRLSSGVHHGVQPLGRPLPQTQALVLSRDNQLCSIGEPGEIVLRTPFRSLGYINNHEENRKRFVKNPFRDDEKDQLYYTGDRGRYRPDGMLEFLGRLDDQVKIRGVRVEPNEITVTIARHPEVDSCFVTNKRDEQSQTRLVAYVVITEQSKTTVSELRAYLKKELPDYMIPSVFVFLDALPLTTRGKVDRRALPAPDLKRSRLETKFVAPRTQVEKVQAKIWCEVLGLDRVGVHDNFFELGGHSLLATQVMSRVRDNFKMELPLLRFFEVPTIAGLTELIETIRLTEIGPRPYRESTTSELEEGEI